MNSKRTLLALQGFSSLSLWLDVFLLFSIPVFAWNVPASSIALLAFCLGAPILFLGPVTGIIADQVNVKNMLLAGLAARAVTTLGLLIAPTFEWFALAAIAKGVANVVFFPAMTITVRQLITVEDRLGYFSMSSLIDQSSKIAAPLLAGLLTHRLALDNIFFISIFALSVSAFLFWSLRKQLDHSQTPARLTFRHLVSDLRDGVSLFKSLPFDLKIGLLYSLLASLALANYDPHLASFIASLGHPPAVYAWLISSTAAGAAFAALAIKFKVINLNPVALRALGLLCFGIGILSALSMTLVSPDNLYLYFIAAWFINGLGYELLVIASNIIIQGLCPPGKIGRISTSFRGLQMLCVVTGPALGSFLIIHYGVVAPLAVSSLLTLTAASTAVYLVFSHRQVRVSTPRTTVE